MRHVLPLLALGCVVEPTSVPDPQHAVPPISLSVSATPFVLGETAEVVVSGATPFTVMYLAYSPNGAGAGICPSSWGGACAGLLNPVSVIRTALTDAGGVATFQIDLPPALPFDEAWMQAAIPGDPAFLSDAFVADIVPADPLERGWDGTGTRPPGPHAIERGLVSAWNIGEPSSLAVVNTSYGPSCDPSANGWGPLFTPPSFDPNQYHYSFYRVSGTEMHAVHQQCINGFPAGCVDSVVTGETPVLEIDDHTLGFQFAPESVQVRGCQIVQQIDWTFEDFGTTGELIFGVDFSVTGACPSSANDGCRVEHSMPLTWVRAE